MGIKAEAHVFKVCQTAKKQPCSDEQNCGQREFDGRKAFSKPSGNSSRRAPAAMLQHQAKIHLRGAPCRCDSKQQTGQKGRPEGEPENSGIDLYNRNWQRVRRQRVIEGPYSPERSKQATNTAKDRKSTRLNSSHSQISYAVFCLKTTKSRPPTP